jgi:hypothetical protein
MKIMMKYPTCLLMCGIALSVVSCVPPSPPVEIQAAVPTEDPFMIYGKSQAYSGSVGSRAAIFTLTWAEDGNIAGSYYHPGDGVVFQLKGKNTSDGQLVLTEFANGTQSAILTLSKSVSQCFITWTGKMHNTDGGVIPVTFSRRL